MTPARAEDLLYVVEFMVRRPLEPASEDEHLIPIRGEIQVIGDDEVPRRCGEVLGWVVEVGRAHEDRIPISDLFDQDGDLMEFYEPLIDEHGWIKDDIRELVEFSGDDLLVIDHMEIDADHRGYDLGLWTMIRAVQVFGERSGLTAIRPFGLQFCIGAEEEDTRLHLDLFTTNEAQALLSVRGYFERLGFLNVPGSDVWILSSASSRPQQPPTKPPEPPKPRKFQVVRGGRHEPWPHRSSKGRSRRPT